MKLAESLSSTSKKYIINETTEKLGDVLKESNLEIGNLKFLPNGSKFNISMRQMLGSLMNSRNSLKINQNEFGQANILGIPIQISVGDRIKIKDIFYDVTPEIYKALSSTSYNCKTMKDEKDILRMFNIINDLVYTGRDDKSSKRKTFFTVIFTEFVEKIQNKTFDEI